MIQRAAGHHVPYLNTQMAIAALTATAVTWPLPARFFSTFLWYA